MVEFIFFLTYDDVTVPNALEVFEQIKDTGVKYVGFKDIGLPKDKLIQLRKRISEEGLTSVLEVVSATKEDNINSIKMAVELDVDYIIGGTCVKEGIEILKGTRHKFFPYVGKIVDHPCLLRGSIDDIVKDAKTVEELGADGIDLLAYRYDGDVKKMIEVLNNSIDIPVICAGSIGSPERIKAVSDLGVWGFTIGTAVFDKKFVPDSDYKTQIEKILEYAS